MKKKVKRIGNSIGILFTKEEQEIYGIQLYDIIEIGEPQVVKTDGKSR